MTRVITLGPVNNTPTNVSFEEAFGEFSELRGRGRARRAARKADRIEKRKARKLERIQAREEVKSARQEARMGRRERRKATRQAIRMEQQAARQDRRNFRAENRLARRAARGQNSEENAPLEQGLDQGVDQEMGQPQDQGYAPQDQGGYDSGSSDQGGYDSGYADQGGYDSGSSDQGGYDATYTDAESPYDYGNDETGGLYEQGDSSEDYGNDYGNDYASDYSTDNDIPEGGDFNFDGVMGAEDRFNELSDTKISVNPDIQSIADKLEWNKELVSRLEDKRNQSNVNPQEISKVILMRTERIGDLSKQLDDYYNCCGYYSSMDANDENGKDFRKKEINYARMRAKTKLTKVQSNLNPKFSENKIVVPSKEGISNLTGMETKEIKNKIAWHKDRLTSLRQQRNALPTGPGNASARQHIQNQIDNQKAKIAELQAQLSGSSNADGTGLNGSNLTGMEIKEIKNKIAWHKDRLTSLRQQRNALPAGPGNASARQQIQNQIDNQKAKIAELQAQLSGSSNADGTGLNGLDLINDYDAPMVREIQLGADGSKSNSGIKLGSVLLGVGIGIAVVWAVKKYNLIK